MKKLVLTLALSCAAAGVYADAHAPAPAVKATDQSVANGMVSAEKVIATENGWMVVHRTDADMKPGAGGRLCPVAYG